jgi:DNA polymerase-3 subunit alpha (Gram-positive type)
LKQKVEKKLSVEEEELLDLYLTTIEACERGIKFIKVDIMKSAMSEFIINREENSLLIPLTCVKSLGEEVAKSVIEARSIKPFTDVDDIRERTKLNKNHIKELTELGSFDHLDKSSQISLLDFFDN